AIVDIQLLNILLLTTLTAKHRESCVSVCSTVLLSTTFTIKFTFLYILRLTTKASLSTAVNINTTSSINKIVDMVFDVINNCSLEIEIEIEGRSIV
ncbi:unnamed protein product, partial [Rotaria magnacalcarata]